MATSVSRDDGKPKGPRRASQAPVLPTNRPACAATPDRMDRRALPALGRRPGDGLRALPPLSVRRRPSPRAGACSTSPPARVTARPCSRPRPTRSSPSTSTRPPSTMREPTTGSPTSSSREGDILDLSDLEDASFDLVTCFETLEHVTDHERAPRRGAAGAHRRGRLAGLDPGPGSPTRSSRRRGNPFHTHEVSRGRARRPALGGLPPGAGLGPERRRRLGHRPSRPEHGSGEVLTLGREQGGWTPGVKLASTYLLAVASRVQLPELAGLLDPGRHRTGARRQERRSGVDRGTRAPS